MVNKVKVNTKKELFPIAEDLYGVFYEDINHAGDGGIYPEMIRNRSFEDSLVPGGCTVDEEQKIYVNRGGWPGAFNHGEGMDEWAAKVPYTPIPGWYAENAIMTLIDNDTLNDKRECALKVLFEESGRLWNIGYEGIPVKNGDTYELYAFVKLEAGKEIALKASLESKAGARYSEADIKISGNGQWQRIGCTLVATGEDYDGIIVFEVSEKAEILFGFTSLMPKETYKGHGLRKDLVEMLEGLSPKFMRYPGGCIVEGLSLETAMRFSNTIGPVWERPSHSLMWHYRTTNGFGFHEFLQLCEDMNMESMYVCNCGISCQARVGEYFDDETVQEFIDEALGAMEYAMGDVSTKYGAMRAAAGHPEPFSIKYVEIGNENWGKEYNERYEKFYKVLKEAYPDVIYISNTHTERDGLPTEYVDEHYYSGPEFFLENDKKFDSYDRNAPYIFLGEYAVNGGNTIASMECAMAEAVFLAGVERNQDIVKLSAYAPLFQNSDYTAWKPNLIVFDNHQVYGIPSYHAIAMMGAHRGKVVVETENEVEMKPPVYIGIPGIMCEKEGLQFKNAKVNGKAVDVSHKVYGSYKSEDDIYTTVSEKSTHRFTGKSDTWNKAFGDFIRGRRHPNAPDEDKIIWLTFGEEDLEEYTFEIDMKFEKDNPITLSVWNYHPVTDAGCNEPKDFDWHFGSVRRKIWKIENGESSTKQRRWFSANNDIEMKPVDINYSEFNTYKIVADHYGYSCYINDELIQEEKHVLHPAVYTVVTTDDENVIIKLIHAGSEDTTVRIDLDCDIEPDVEVVTLAGKPEDVNSMEDKEHISPKTSMLESDNNIIEYNVPAYSVNVLKAKKK